MRILQLLPVLAVVACVDSRVPTAVDGDRANESHLVNDKVDVVDVAMQACNGETVLMSGTAHTKIDFDFSPNGDMRFASSTRYTLTGVGPVTGATYHGSETIIDKVKIDPTTISSSSTSEVTMRLVAQGNVPNTVLGFKSHTVMKDGDVKVSQTDFTSRCK